MHTHTHTYAHTHTSLHVLHRELLQAVSKVTIDQLRSVGKRYFSKLFCPEHTSCAVCCTVNKVEEIREMLAG